MRRLVLPLALAAIVTSCSEVSNSDSSLSTANTLTVTALADQGSATRISYSEDLEGGAWRSAWEEGDNLGAVGVGTSQSAMNKFEMVNFNEKSSTFAGEIASESARFIYPYSAEEVIDGGYYMVDLSEQQFDLESRFKSLSRYAAMISSSAIDINDKETTIAMKHISAAAELSLRFEGLDTEKYDYRLNLVKIGSEKPTDGFVEVPIACDIDLAASVEEDSFYSSWAYGQIISKASSYKTPIYNYDATDESTTYKVVFNTLPFDIAADESLNVTWNLFRISKETKVQHEIYNHVAIKNNSGDKISLARATRNYINCKCDTDGCWIKISIGVGIE